KSTIITFFSFLFIVVLNGQDLHLKLGRVTDSVILPNTTDTYALYLPKNFSMGKKWPVIFLFDPEARGKAAILHFTEAAENYGYILVASNATKNGPYQINFRKASLLINGFIGAFPIDEQRIYFAG